MGKRGPKPKGRVKLAWSSDLAYVLGLITADGSLSRDGLHIDFTSRDLQLVRLYRALLNLEGIKIGKKAGGNRPEKIYYRVQFGDVLFYRWLTKRGLQPNKSKTLSAVDVIDKHFFDFVRGYWDGDGSIYGFVDTRWKSSYTYSISFTSGSTAFLEWLKEGVNQRLGTTGFSSRVQGGYQLRFAKKDTQKIFNKMFPKTREVPHLKRKFAKAQKIFRIDARNSR